MESKNNSDWDEFINDIVFLEKLIIGIGEVAEITKVPTRQIRYWENKGYIKSISEEGKNRRYNYANIKKILLIKEMIDEGYTLEASVAKIKNRMKIINEAFKKIRNKSPLSSQRGLVVYKTLIRATDKF